MSFNTLTFFVFLAIVLTTLRLLSGSKPKVLFLVAASLFFYAWWDLRLVPLLLGLALVNFGLGRVLAQPNASARRRKTALVVGIVANLVVLAWFKYVNFFLDTLKPLLGSLGLHTGTIDVLLPLGISFFVFEFISFLVDQFHNKIHRTLLLREFLAFSFFFPRLASGPIIRPADFLPQLDQPLQPTAQSLREGAQIFLLGLVKKVVIADNLAVASDTVFANPGVYDTVTIWFGVVAYAIQIYCDFSGYSDMAIGTARMLGIRLPLNFRTPYVSTTITEFWRRWHLSLSTWLRDYLYIPLGGNRKGDLRREVNLFLTMLLGGLWHGAAWTFVLWGGLHGAGLAVQKLWSQWSSRQGFHLPGFLKALLGWVLTMAFVLVTWVIFRSPTLEGALTLLTRMFVPTQGIQWLYWPLVWGILPLVGVATWYRHHRKDEGYILFDLTKPLPQFGFFIAVLGVFVLHAAKAAPFIYFQF